MKTLMNFTDSPDDLARYASAEDLRRFYKQFHCDGLELMPFMKTPLSETFSSAGSSAPVLTQDMIVGIHTCGIPDWIDLDREFLLKHYRKDLDYADAVGAEYVVFHVTQVNDDESMTYHFLHENEQVIDAACDLINDLLDGQNYQFHFLMENLWWSGLTMRDPALTKRLLDGVHYEKKGLMLDTGHYLHTNHQLRTQTDAVRYLNEMLDAHQDLIPMIKGVHLQQSLSGDYVQQFLQNPPALPEDPMKRSELVYTHIFRIDQHLPFTDPGVRALVERVDPLYVNYEYITRSRSEHVQYLQAGSQALLRK